VERTELKQQNSCCCYCCQAAHANANTPQLTTQSKRAFAHKLFPQSSTAQSTALSRAYRKEIAGKQTRLYRSTLLCQGASFLDDADEKDNVRSQQDD
jgi:hypothetical protein